MLTVRMLGHFTIAFAIAAGMASTAHAQGLLRTERFSTPLVMQQSENGSIPKMAAIGLLGGGIGLVVGGLGGTVITDDRSSDSSDDLSFLSGMVVGGTIGESLMLPLGVHLGNKRRGQLMPAMLASLAIGAGGVVLAIATEDQAPLPGVILALTPIAQLVTSIAIERSTSN